MYHLHTLHEQWLNGNRKHVVEELTKLEPEEVKKFASFLSRGETFDLIVSALDRIPRSDERKWFDQNWQPVTEQEVIESEFPLECPSEAQAVAERTHAEILMKEGTGSYGVFQVWIRKVLRAYMYADQIKADLEYEKERG